MDDVFKGSCAILAATFCWALGSGVFLKFLTLTGFPVVWAAFFSCLIAGVVLYFFSSGKKSGLSSSNSWVFIGLALFSGLHIAFAYVGFQSTEFGTVSVLQLLSVPLSAFAAWFFLKESLPLKTVAAMSLALVGVFVVNGFSFTGFSSIGAAFAIISSFFIAGIMIFARMLKEEFTSMTAAFVLLGSALVILPIALVFSPLPALSLVSVALLALIALFDLALGEFLKFYAVSKAPVRIVSILELFQSVTFSIAGLFAFGQILPENSVVGGILIIFASALVLL